MILRYIIHVIFYMYLESTAEDRVNVGPTGGPRWLIGIQTPYKTTMKEKEPVTHLCLLEHRDNSILARKPWT
jgi:hypothetical protein